MHPQGLGHGFDQARQRWHDVNHLGELARSRHQTLTCVGHDGLARMGPHLEVNAVVARVIKTLFTKAPHQLRSLVASGQVGLAIAGQHPVEQASVIGHGLGKPVVRCGDQQQGSTRFLLGLQPGQQGLGVRQGAAVEFHPGGDFRLEPRFATEQPQGHQQQVKRVSLEQEEERLQQQVAVNERAIEVDAKRGLVRHGQKEEGSRRRSQTQAHPITTASQRVNKRQMRVSKMAKGALMPWAISRAAITASVLPRPPGKKDKAPAMSATA